MQLNAANVAKTDALRRVNQLTEKFEAASKAIYQVTPADPTLLNLYRSFSLMPLVK